MATPITIDLDTLLSPQLMKDLTTAAAEQKLEVGDIVRDALELYLYQDEEEYEDTPDEEILENLRDSLKAALAGNVRPAREVLAEIQRELDDEMNNHADKG
jgi:hypothetical protein